MLTRLFLIFILLPLADLILILMLVRIYWPATVIWILVSALLGAWFIRRQGTHVLKQMRQTLDQNKVPTDILLEAFMVVFAGFLLMLPGLITDIFGLSVLFQPTRRWYRIQFVAWLKKRVHTTTFTMHHPGHGSDVVDATVVGRRSEESADQKTNTSNSSDRPGIAR